MANRKALVTNIRILDFRQVLTDFINAGYKHCAFVFNVDTASYEILPIIPDDPKEAEVKEEKKDPFENFGFDEALGLN